MKKETKFALIFISGAMISMCFMGLWAVDVGAAGIASGGYITSGFWMRNPMQQYHIGLWLIEGSALFMFMITCATIILTDKKEANKNEN